MTLPLKGTLSPEDTTSPVFQFNGEVCILIEGGSGTVEIQRSLRGSEFKALTDTLGNKVAYEANDDVALNAEIACNHSSCSYRIVATEVSAPINYVICK